MGPVSISPLSFPDSVAATQAARLLRSEGIRVEALNETEGPDGPLFVVLIRSSDMTRAGIVLNADGEPSE